MRKRKSIPFYIVCVCLALIVTSCLYALLWQPSFEHGVISIKIMGSKVGYSLWGFMTALLLLIVFILLSTKVFRSPKEDKPSFIVALLAGIGLIILLGQITYGWTTYPSLSFLERSQLTAEKYGMMMLSIKSLIAIGVAFLVYKWYKQKDTAANTGLPK
jgi:heme/copper-type cytochrome/quinol oxidase subunit 1